MSSGEITLGFIGVGVMGKPICRNFALKSGASVFAYGRDSAPLDRLAAHGVRAAASAMALAQQAEIVFLSLPSGEAVAEFARDSAVDASGARNADGWLREAIEAGDGKLYFPVISRLIGRKH